MASVVFYFQVHQPFRLKPYDCFKIGHDSVYDDDAKNKEILDLSKEQNLYFNELVTYDRDRRDFASADEYEQRAIEFANGAGNERLVALARLGRAEITYRRGDAQLAGASARRVAADFAPSRIKKRWRELDERTRGFAAALNRRGVGFGDRILIVMLNRSEYVEAVLGANLIGAIPVPVTTISLSAATMRSSVSLIRVRKVLLSSSTTRSPALMTVPSGGMNTIFASSEAPE